MWCRLIGEHTASHSEPVLLNPQIDRSLSPTPHAAVISIQGFLEVEANFLPSNVYPWFMWRTIDAILYTFEKLLADYSICLGRIAPL